MVRLHKRTETWHIRLYELFCAYLFIDVCLIHVWWTCGRTCFHCNLVVTLWEGNSSHPFPNSYPPKHLSSTKTNWKWTSVNDQTDSGQLATIGSKDRFPGVNRICQRSDQCGEEGGNPNPILSAQTAEALGGSRIWDLNLQPQSFSHLLLVHPDLGQADVSSLKDSLST